MTLVIDAETAADQATSPMDGTYPEFEALFPEAEQHQRFRRMRLAALAAVIFIVAGITWGVLASGASNSSPAFGLSHAAFSASVGYATQHAQSARIAVAEDNGTDRCVEQQRPITSGVVSFTQSTLFLQWPQSACDEPSGTLRTKSEIVDKRLYVYFPSVTRSGKRGSNVWHAVLGSMETEATTFFEPVGRAVSPAPWRILDAVTAPLQRVGTSTIQGTETTEYRGSASLASVMATYPSIRAGMNGVNSRTPLSKLIVPVANVHIPVLVWLDSEHRIRRLEVSEPQFEADIPHTRGEMITGFDLSRTESVPKDINHQDGTMPSQRETVHLTNLRILGTYRIEIDLYDFGTPAHVTAPNTAHVGPST